MAAIHRSKSLVKEVNVKGFIATMHSLSAVTVDLSVALPHTEPQAFDRGPGLSRVFST